MDSAFVYINCWAHIDGSIEKWRQNLNCYRKPSSTSFARFLSSLVLRRPEHNSGMIIEIISIYHNLRTRVCKNGERIFQ